MNNKRREFLKLTIQLLDKASNYLSQAVDEEQDCLDNMPDNLHSSDRYDKMEKAIGNLEEAIESIDSAKENIDEALS